MRNPRGSWREAGDPSVSGLSGSLDGCTPGSGGDAARVPSGAPQESPSPHRSGLGRARNPLMCSLIGKPVEPPANRFPEALGTGPS